MTREWLTKWSKFEKTKIRATKAQGKLFDTQYKKLSLGSRKSIRGRGRGRRTESKSPDAVKPVARGNRGNGKKLVSMEGDE